MQSTGPMISITSHSISNESSKSVKTQRFTHCVQRTNPHLPQITTISTDSSTTLKARVIQGIILHSHSISQTLQFGSQQRSTTCKKQTTRTKGRHERNRYTPWQFLIRVPLNGLWRSNQYTQFAGLHLCAPVCYQNESTLLWSKCVN